MNNKLKKLIKDKRFEKFILEAVEIMKSNLDTNQVDMSNEDIKYAKSLIEFGNKLKENLNNPIFSSDNKLTFNILQELGVNTLDDIEYIKIDICKQIEFPLGVTEWSGVKIKGNDEFMTFIEADYDILENLNDVNAIWEEEVKVKDILPCFDESLLEELLEKKVPFCFAYEDDRIPLQEYLDDERDMCIGEDHDT